MTKKSDKWLTDDASDLNHEAYGRGAKLFCEGNFNLAKHDFKLALEYWSEDPEAWMALGNCFDELKKPKKSRGMFQKITFILFG